MDGVTNESGIITCPLCECPHRVGAVTCDACGQALDARPDLSALRSEYAERKRDIGFSLRAIIVMLVLNLVVFGGAGYVVLLAPLGWLVRSAIRHRALGARLARLETPSAES